jgi:hypothetical protein
MASREQIANRALQKIGAARVTSLDDGSRNADAVSFAFDFLRDSELQMNFWTFAIRRVSIAADSVAPIFGRTLSYALPADYLRIAPDDPHYPSYYTDRLFEGRKILTDEGGPLQIRYVSNGIPEEQWDPLFADALAMRIAMEVCEELTQSSTKRDAAETAYKYFVDMAKKVNSIVAGPITPEIDEIVAVRSSEAGAPFLRRFTT